MKVWISFDMEGVAGIVDWEQCRPSGGARYAVGCQLMLDEVNAAIEGAIAGGATEVVLNDSHGTMANLDPRLVAGEASYIAGRHKPLYMMQGLDETVDALRDKFGEDIIYRAKFAAQPETHMAGGLSKARRTGVTKPVPEEF